ncbi:MAG: hypothetical protein CMM00_04360, partial [Rhodopirellula sp.]|nr:hypothetical protein [Rhodopirellula sp.]
SPETKFGERSSDAVQAYARVRAEHGKRCALPSPEFSLNACIPTLPNCVQEGDFNLASTALQNCTTSYEEGLAWLQVSIMKPPFKIQHRNRSLRHESDPHTRRNC